MWLKIKSHFPGVVRHIFNPSTLEGRVRGISLSSRLAWPTYEFQASQSYVVRPGLKQQQQPLPSHLPQVSFSKMTLGWLGLVPQTGWFYTCSDGSCSPFPVDPVHRSQVSCHIALLVPWQHDNHQNYMCCMTCPSLLGELIKNMPCPSLLGELREGQNK